MESRHDVIGVAINSSKEWSSCQVLKLSENMRLSATANNDEAQNQMKFFADLCSGHTNEKH